MSRPAAVFWIVLAVAFGFLPHWARASNSTLFHYSIHESTPLSNALAFPFRLTGGQSREAVTAALQHAGFQRGDYDKDSTLWVIRGKINAQAFQPSVVSLKYVDDKLMQVTLIQPNVSECRDIIAIVQDAVGYIQKEFTFPPKNVRPGSRFNSNNCVFYMKPGQSGWQTTAGDYAVGIETNWRSGKEMVYSAFMTFTYIPIYMSLEKDK